MTRTRRRALALAVGLAAGSMAAAAVSPVGATTKSTKATAAAPASTSDLPRVAVTDLKTKKAVNLSTLTAAKKPILLWFWAPH
jgi:hypothetical protein